MKLWKLLALNRLSRNRSKSQNGYWPNPVVDGQEERQRKSGRIGWDEIKMDEQQHLQQLRSKLFQTFGKLTRFENEVVEALGSLVAAAADQIPIAERVLAERPCGVAGFAREVERQKVREGFYPEGYEED